MLHNFLKGITYQKLIFYERIPLTARAFLHLPTHLLSDIKKSLAKYVLRKVFNIVIIGLYYNLLNRSPL